MSQVIELKIGELELKVHGTFHPYKHNGYYDPPDNEEFEIDKVMLGPYDITELLDLNIIEESCLEQIDAGRYWD